MHKLGTWLCADVPRRAATSLAAEAQAWSDGLVGDLLETVGLGRKVGVDGGADAIAGASPRCDVEGTSRGMACTAWSAGRILFYFVVFEGKGRGADGAWHG